MKKCNILYSGISGNCDWFNKTSNIKTVKKKVINLSSFYDEVGDGGWQLFPQSINHPTNPFARFLYMVSTPINLIFQDDFSYNKILGVELDMIMITNGANVTQFEGFFDESWHIFPNINLNDFQLNSSTGYHQGSYGGKNDLLGHTFTENTFNNGLRFKMSFNGADNLFLIKFDLNVYYN